MLLNEYLNSEFGEKLYKLSFDIGATCPNRDGYTGVGGCAFCSEGGSGDFALELNPDNIEDIVNKAKEKVKDKFKGDRFIAYIQSHTNTYFNDKVTPDYLKNILYQLAKRDDIAVVSIGTRADCIDREVINILSDINMIKPVWVEIGLQTIHQKTLDNMNCCFNIEDFERSYRLLNNSNIKTIVHMIVGLPGESDDEILETAKYIASIKPFGIKIQLLHVLKNTKLADIYNNVGFRILSLEEYTDLVAEIVKMLPKEVVIHRMTGDGPRNLLIEPKWSTDKKRVLNTLNSKIDVLNRGV